MTLQVTPVDPMALLGTEPFGARDGDSLQAIFDLDPDIGERLERILDPGGRAVTVLVARSEPNYQDQILGFIVGSMREGDPELGVVEMVAVRPGFRRLGVATALLAGLEAALAAQGAARFAVMGNAPVYAWPGVDVGYTAALCLFEARGYTRGSDAIDMTVDLARLATDGAFDGTLSSAAPQPIVGELEIVALGAGQGADSVDVRAAAETWIAAEFAANWRREVEQTLARAEVGRVAGVVVAIRTTDRAIVGFAAYGAQRAALFGPMGTAASARGTGIGTRLLIECFAAQQQAGLTAADIGWVGPIAFYSRTTGARVSRTYALLQKG